MDLLAKIEQERQTLKDECRLAKAKRLAPKGTRPKYCSPRIKRVMAEQLDRVERLEVSAQDAWRLIIDETLPFDWQALPQEQVEYLMSSIRGHWEDALL